MATGPVMLPPIDPDATRRAIASAMPIISQAYGIGAPQGAAGAPAIAPPPSASTAIAGPTIQAAAAAPPAAPGVPAQPKQSDIDQKRINDLTAQGSGIHQIKNPWLKGLATVGEIAGSSLFPSVVANIPGTQLHHNELIAGAEGRQKQDVANEEAGARENAEGAQADEQRAAAKKAGEKTPEQLAFESEIANGTDPMSAFQKVQGAVSGSKQTPEEQLWGVLSNPKTTPDQRQSALATYKQFKQAGQPPHAMEHVEVAGPDGKPIEANYDSMLGTYSAPGGSAISNPTPYVAPKPNTAGVVNGVPTFGREMPDGTFVDPKSNQPIKDFRPAPTYAETGMYEPTVAITPDGKIVSAKFDRRTGNTVGANGETNLFPLPGPAATQVGKELSDARGADTRLRVMSQNATDALNGIKSGHANQQAEMSLLTNHIGMTLGMQKGARINQAVFKEAQNSVPLLAGVAAKFDKDGYLQGVTLTANQIKQMTDLAQQRRDLQWQQVSDTFSQYGIPFNGPPVQGGQTLTMAQVQQAAKDHSVTIEEAKKQAVAAGFTIH